MPSAGARAVERRPDRAVNSFTALISRNKIIFFWANWKHEGGAGDGATSWLMAGAPFQVARQTKLWIYSTLFCTRLPELRHNSHCSGFVWREPANCITLISQAVFSQVITMPRALLREKHLSLKLKWFLNLPIQRSNVIICSSTVTFVAFATNFVFWKKRSARVFPLAMFSWNFLGDFFS